MRILALDISTKTGFAVFNSCEPSPPTLVECGVFRLDKKVTDYHTDYPFSYYLAAQEMVRLVRELILRWDPDVVVVEEPTLGKSRFAQRILEWIHAGLVDSLLNSAIKPAIKLVYVAPSSWRSALGLVLSKDDKSNNKKLKTAVTLAEITKTKLSKKDLGVKGKIGKKHLSVRWANEKFGLGLKMKDNDKADAIGLGMGWIAGARHVDGK